MAGILQTYGSHAIQRTIIDHKDTILQSADWSNNSYGELGQGQAGLPEPPKAIDNCTHGECKVLIVAIMKSVVGNGFDKHVGWGKPDRIPSWWPANVPWTKRGVQQGVSLGDMRKVLHAAYKHFELVSVINSFVTMNSQ